MLSIEQTILPGIKLWSMDPILHKKQIMEVAHAKNTELITIIISGCFSYVNQTCHRTYVWFLLALWENLSHRIERVHWKTSLDRASKAFRWRPWNRISPGTMGLCGALWHTVSHHLRRFSKPPALTRLEGVWARESEQNTGGLYCSCLPSA